MPTPSDHLLLASRDGVEARIVDDPDDAARAVALLDQVEREEEVPPVDESERVRLQSLAAADETAPHWHAVLACRGEDPVGYAGVVVPGHAAGDANGDLVVARGAAGFEPAIEVLLDVLARLAARHRAHRLQVWLRHAGRRELDLARDAGFGIERRLAVMGRDLGRLPPIDVPPGITIRPFRGTDADAVVEVLARAYAGTPDAGWTRERLDERRHYDWFDPDDLLIAEEDGRVVAVHWTKRRDGTTGEVYNLAVHPTAQGRGLGGLVLRAGLRHLADRGCRDLILWVDRDNERGVRLYGAHGFETRWEDVALACELS